MKKLLPVIILSSVLSAMLTIFFYSKWMPTREVIIRDSYVPSKPFIKDQKDKATSVKFIGSTPTDFTHAAEAVAPTVVNIKSYPDENSYYAGEVATGSGVIVSEDGYIVTNNHVVEGASRLSVSLNDKREYEATVVGTDSSTDLALIKIDEKNLAYLPFGNSDSLRIGEWVLAVGNPLNLELTITAGIVSAKGRSIDILEGQDRIESFIQTDAVVNPGNSGGALINTHGQLIGINTAIITQSGRYEGYSFAIPGNLVLKVIGDIKEYGVVQRGLLGVFIREVDNEIAETLELQDIAGILIERVVENGGAEKAGLQSGDVIIGIDNSVTEGMPEMQELVGRHRPGDKITVKYIRAGQVKKCAVTLGGNIDSNKPLAIQEEKMLRSIGCEVRNLTKMERREITPNGIRIVSVFRNSKIDRTNMEPGFIITKLDDKKITNVDQFVQLLENASGKTILEGVYENYPGEYYYAFSVD